MIVHSLAAALSMMTIASELSQTPLEKLNFALQHIGGSPGQLGYEAKREGFDYRRHLRRAIDGKEAAFAALFDFTLDGQLTGIAARQHSENLYNLLRYRGDDFFSGVLRTRRPEVQRRVVSWLDSQLNPVWQPKTYPKTFRLGRVRDKSEDWTALSLTARAPCRGAAADCSPLERCAMNRANAGRFPALVN
jgi:hypothetical protein